MNKKMKLGWGLYVACVVLGLVSVAEMYLTPFHSLENAIWEVASLSFAGLIYLNIRIFKLKWNPHWPRRNP